MRRGHRKKKKNLNVQKRKETRSWGVIRGQNKESCNNENLSVCSRCRVPGRVPAILRCRRLLRLVRSTLTSPDTSVKLTQPFFLFFFFLFSFSSLLSRFSVRCRWPHGRIRKTRPPLSLISDAVRSLDVPAVPFPMSSTPVNAGRKFGHFRYWGRRISHALLSADVPRYRHPCHTGHGTAAPITEPG